MDRFLYDRDFRHKRVKGSLPDSATDTKGVWANELTTAPLKIIRKQ